MKKSKNGLLPIEKDLSSSKGFGILSDDEELDEEIIDLEEIVEMGFQERSKWERIDLEEEILDADGDLDLSDFEAEGHGGRDNGVLRDDLLKDLALDEDLDAPGRVEEEPKPSIVGGRDKSARGRSADDLADSGSPDLEEELDLLFQEEEKDDFEKLLASNLSIPEGSGTREEPPGLQSERVPPAPLVQAVAPAARPTELPDIEGIVEQIEARLVQAVRDIVEARLPGIVQALLREEIENLKKDLS